MKTVITHHHEIENTSTVLLVHPSSGLQIEITPSRNGFIIKPGVPTEINRWEGISYEIIAIPNSCGAQ
jgi:hypothetical protein